MKTSMLDYVKLVLQKVSFHVGLFEKELRKGIRWLSPTEAQQLKEWCYEQYGKAYPQVLKRCFRLN